MDLIRDDAKKMIAEFQEKHVVSSIRVFITETHGGKCYTLDTGGGDWYSCFGYVTHWVEEQMEQVRVNVRNSNATSDGEKSF